METGAYSVIEAPACTLIQIRALRSNGEGKKAFRCTDDLPLTTVSLLTDARDERNVAVRS